MKGIGYFLDLKIEGIERGREGFEFVTDKERRRRRRRRRVQR